MQSKILFKWLFIIFGGAAVIFLVKIFPFSSVASVNPVLSSVNPVTQALPSIRVGLPTRLVIPEINVNALIKGVGLTSQGAMAVPVGPTNVTWFDLGPRPGEIGSAVIAGHEGWKDGIWAVFDDLYKLRRGDKIYVENAQNTTTTFVVVNIQRYDQHGNASNVFNSKDGKAHLNLITCEGTWNAAQQSYSNRLVIFANEENQ